MESNFTDDMIEDIKSSKDKNNICGLIVKIADTLQSSIKIYEECRLGNFHFNKIIEENIIFVGNLRDIVQSSELSSKSPSTSRAIDTLLDVVDEFEHELSVEINRLTN